MHFVKGFTISDTSKVKNIHPEDRLADRHLDRLPGSVAKFVSLSVDAAVIAGQARSRRDCMSQSWVLAIRVRSRKTANDEIGKVAERLVQMPTDHDVSS